MRDHEAVGNPERGMFHGNSLHDMVNVSRLNCKTGKKNVTKAFIYCLLIVY